MKDYEVITGNCSDHHSRLVNEKIKTGFVLVGGVSVCPKNGHLTDYVFSQAVAKLIK